MSAAWLMSGHVDLTVYEADGRIGGHTNTVVVNGPQGEVPVDTGFIVFNEFTYPNLVALFRHLGVETLPTDMSFAASLNGGSLEYSGDNLFTLFAQKRNILRPRFWSMLYDLKRFYAQAPCDLDRLDEERTTLGDYLDMGGYGQPFRDDHLLPMAAAIWSAPASTILDYPAASFIRFKQNHGLLKITGRPVWRTVAGGSREYARRLTAPYADRIRCNAGAVSVARTPAGVRVRDAAGGEDVFDHVVFATHADQALRLLADPTDEERNLLGAFGYSTNEAFLHRDTSLMPKRRSVWSSWNYIEAGERSTGESRLVVTYWMNRLQHIPRDNPLFVTLNPPRPPAEEHMLRRETYEHPVFDCAAMAAQRRLWSLQGVRGTWFCGAYFGAGFHEDGLQSGLAVAEQLAGVRRPWTVENESGRICVNAPARTPADLEVAA